MPCRCSLPRPRSSRPLTGFDATPTWGPLEDCWQQLAVVKSGPQLTFYYNGQAAGAASASFIVNDYGGRGVLVLLVLFLSPFGIHPASACLGVHASRSSCQPVD